MEGKVESTGGTEGRTQTKTVKASSRGGKKEEEIQKESIKERRENKERRKEIRGH